MTDQEPAGEWVKVVYDYRIIVADPIDTGRVRDDWPINDEHRDTTGNRHCDTCHQRMPCDWSMATADIHALCEEIDRLRAELVEASR